MIAMREGVILTITGKWPADHAADHALLLNDTQQASSIALNEPLGQIPLETTLEMQFPGDEFTQLALCVSNKQLP